MSKSLKDKYFWKLQGFVALNLIIFISIIIGIKAEEIFINKLNFDLFKEFSPAIISILITVILAGILPSNIKAKIVFHRWKNPLPGSRIFTELASSDSRINLEKIEGKYGQLPVAPKKQNQFWYSIYKGVRDKVTIKKSHHDFLFLRDLTAVSFIFLIVLSLSLLFVENSLKFKALYVCYLIVQFVVLKVTAQNYGNRFACNVLAEVS